MKFIENKLLKRLYIFIKYKDIFLLNLRKFKKQIRLLFLYLQHPGHGTGPSSTIWGRGPYIRGYSLRMKSPGFKSRVAIRHLPRSSVTTISYGRHNCLWTFQCFFWCSLPQYDISLQAEHFNSAGFWHSAQIFSVML